MCLALKIIFSTNDVAQVCMLGTTTKLALRLDRAEGAAGTTSNLRHIAQIQHVEG